MPSAIYARAPLRVGVAAAISFDAIIEDHPEVVLRDRARVLLGGDDGQCWDNPLGVTRALTVAATVLDVM